MFRLFGRLFIPITAISTFSLRGYQIRPQSIIERDMVGKDILTVYMYTEYVALYTIACYITQEEMTVDACDTTFEDYLANCPPNADWNFMQDEYDAERMRDRCVLLHYAGKEFEACDFHV